MMKKLLLVVFVGLVVTHSSLAQKTTSTVDSGFSFDVYGDSRSMMYLPYKASQEADARKLMVAHFESLAAPSN